MWIEIIAIGTIIVATITILGMAITEQAKEEAIMDNKRDKQIFSRTATKTKQINIHAKNFRGGIRI